jgi:hypothetical protein
VASELPPTIFLDGFDISDYQFPHKSLLPSNIKLAIMDSFGEVPKELVGKYDVVHMRLWCCVITGGDPSQLILHAITLLSTLLSSAL